MSVAVIGAGAAGLACAAALADSRCPVEVFEASRRVGGRVRSWSGDGQVWELGAQVIHPAGHALLAGRYGLPAVPAPRGEFAFLLDEVLVPLGRAARIGLRPWELAGRLPIQTGIDGRNDAPDCTVASHLARAVRSGAPARVGQAWFEQEWSSSTGLLSTDGTAAWVADRTAIAGVEAVVPQGMSILVEQLAQRLSVHRETPVRQVGRPAPRVRDGRRTGPRARPWLAVDGGRLEFEAVVITVPPWTFATGARRGLEFIGWPESALRAASALPVGDAVAAVLTWSHACPADRTVFDVGGTGFLRAREGARQIQLVSKGPSAAVLRSVLADSRAMNRLLRSAFEWTDGGTAVDVAVADWGRNRWIGGAFSAPTLGHRSARQALRSLAGDGLFMAGEATRPDGSAGRLHGAVQSGIDAAADVLAFLSVPPPTLAGRRSDDEED